MGGMNISAQEQSRSLRSSQAAWAFQNIKGLRSCCAWFLPTSQPPARRCRPPSGGGAGERGLALLVGDGGVCVISAEGVC